MTNLLKSRTIQITGGNDVPGINYVCKMLASGARVMATNLPRASGETLRSEFASQRNFRACDLAVGDEDQIKEFFKPVAADGYAPNDLLNNTTINGGLLMITGKSFPDLTNKTLED